MEKTKIESSAIEPKPVAVQQVHKNIPAIESKSDYQAAKLLQSRRRRNRFSSSFFSVVFFSFGVGATMYLYDELHYGQVHDLVRVRRHLQRINDSIIKSTKQSTSAAESSANSTNNNNANGSLDINSTTNAADWFKHLLSKESLSAFKIQSFYRQRKTRKQYLNYLRRKTYEIRVYTTSLAIDINTVTDQERIKYILDAMKIKYQWIDLYEAQNKSNQKMIQESDMYGGSNNLPIIIVNNHYIGGIQELQDLVDEGWLMPILQKQYEDQCIQCQVTRESLDDNMCKFCWQKYLFFVKKYDDSLQSLFANYNNNQQQYNNDIDDNDPDSMTFGVLGNTMKSDNKNEDGSNNRRRSLLKLNKELSNSSNGGDDDLLNKSQEIKLSKKQSDFIRHKVSKRERQEREMQTQQHRSSSQTAGTGRGNRHLMGRVQSINNMLAGGEITTTDPRPVQLQQQNSGNNSNRNSNQPPLSQSSSSYNYQY
eukprot:403352296